jgi:hypothetical protein
MKDSVLQIFTVPLTNEEHGQLNKAYPPKKN